MTQARCKSWAVPRDDNCSYIIKGGLVRVGILFSCDGDRVAANASITIYTCVVPSKGYRKHIDRSREFQHDKRAGVAGAPNPTVVVAVHAVVDMAAVVNTE